MTSYKLTYFNARARAEVTRMLFAVAGVEYEDIRIERADWTEIKRSATPFCQLPLLEVDGKIFCQSHAIERFLAKRFGLMGDTEIEQFNVDMISSCLEDARQTCIVIRRSGDKDPEGMKEKTKVYQEKQLPEHLDKLQAMLPPGADYFVGNKLSLADIRLAVNLDTPGDMIGVAVPWERYPRLAHLRDRVRAHPRIADWIQKRPATAV